MHYDDVKTSDSNATTAIYDVYSFICFLPEMEPS